MMTPATAMDQRLVSEVGLAIRRFGPFVPCSAEKFDPREGSLRRIRGYECAKVYREIPELSPIVMDGEGSAKAGKLAFRARESVPECLSIPGSDAFGHVLMDGLPTATSTVFSNAVPAGLPGNRIHWRVTQ